MPGLPYDGHTMAEALEQAGILGDVTPEMVFVDRGYRGVELEGVKIYHPGLRRGITRGLRVMIRRRSAIEPAIGHMKSEEKPYCATLGCAARLRPATARLPGGRYHAEIHRDESASDFSVSSVVILQVDGDESLAIEFKNDAPVY